MRQRQSLYLRLVCGGVIVVIATGNYANMKWFIRDCKNLQGTLEIVGIAKADAVIEQQTTVLDIQSVQFGDPRWCRARVMASEGDEIQKGDHVRLKVTLEPLALNSNIREERSYAYYLKTKHIGFTGMDAMLLQHESGKEWEVYKEIRKVRQQIENRIHEIFTEPYATLAAALLLGRRTEIPKSIKKTFADVGISHILAISGLHIAIVMTTLRSILLKTPLSRRAASGMSSIVVLAYIGIIGGSISAIRATMMGLTGLMNEQIGIPTNGLNVLLIVAAWFATQNPYIVLHDVGYQLSFAATFGILTLLPRFQTFAEQHHIPDPIGIRTSLSLTLAASMTTAPILLYSFRSFSLLSFLANLLVIPVLPWLFLSMAVSLVCGTSCAWATWGMMEYIFRVSEFLQRYQFFIIHLP